MFGFSPTTRIVMVQVSLAMMILMIGLSLGIVPDHRPHLLEGRARLCEALAAEALSAASGEQQALQRVREILQLMVDRYDDLRSAALRRADGRLEIEIGDHQASWPDNVAQAASDAFIQVPIHAGADEIWGSLQLRFDPVMPPTVAGMVIGHPWVHLGAFVGSLMFLVYAWYLNKMLDPTRAVPKRVRTAFDFLAGGLVALDKQQRILLCNRAILEILGVTREELTGLGLSGLAWQFCQGDGNASVLPWEHVAKRHDSELGAMLQIESRTLGMRTLMVNAAPVIGQDGEFRAILVGFEDITPLEKARAELQLSKAAAESANVAKTAFLANMSHEIRTPMNAILGFADILRRGFDNNPDERQEYLQIIHSSGQHLLMLINDILDLSKVESGRMEIESIPCEPFRIVHEVASSLRMLADERGLTLSYRIDGAIPQSIDSDPVRLRQVLTNLVNNALKFTEQGGVTMLLRVAGTPPNQRLAFDVIDTGIGIPANKLEKVFEVFSQADSSTTRKYGGTGLGLAISRKLAEMMGGGLIVESEVGRGSRFTAEVAMGAASSAWIRQDDLTELLRSQAVSAQQFAQLASARVLLADDGASNRRLIELVLGRAGITVVSAEDGAQAVEIACAEPFDVILMDMQMPVMDGYTATGQLRQAGFDVPIVAMTAHAMKEDEQKCRAAGCSHFLPKPVDVDALLALMAELVGMSDTESPPTVCRHTQRTDVMIPSSGETKVDARVGDLPARVLCSLPLEDAEFYDIAAEFVERLQERLREMALNLYHGDFEELARAAHWLKGAGGTAGFTDFTEPARQLEVTAKQQQHEEAEQALSVLLQLQERISLPGRPAAELVAVSALP